VSTQLRMVRANVVEFESAAQLEQGLNNFFRQSDRGVFLSAFQIASLSILILYAEG
jgi:hypothetical protein